MVETPLKNRVIAVPETRELDVFSELLTRRGASVLRCPLVSILDAPDPQPVLAWIRAFNDGACDDLILLTGEGLRRLLACIAKHEPALHEGFVARLAVVRKIARGPKPGRALRELGLKPELVAQEPTTPGVIATLRTENLKNRRIGVQLYGSEPNLPLIDFLKAAGARVSTVAPYVYADAAKDADVLALIEKMAAGTVDAIAFTSKSQIERLFAVAAKSGVDAAQALARTRVAVIGPVVRDELATHGVKADLMPMDAYFLKPLTQLLSESLKND
ncbi:MAG: uroporphyrinogen-III synthase [Pseudomonadota bacterium]